MKMKMKRDERRPALKAGKQARPDLLGPSGVEKGKGKASFEARSFGLWSNKARSKSAHQVVLLSYEFLISLSLARLGNSPTLFSLLFSCHPSSSGFLILTSSWLQGINNSFRGSKVEKTETRIGDQNAGKGLGSTVHTGATPVPWGGAHPPTWPTHPLWVPVHPQHTTSKTKYCRGR